MEVAPQQETVPLHVILCGAGHLPDPAGDIPLGHSPLELDAEWIDNEED